MTRLFKDRKFVSSLVILMALLLISWGEVHVRASKEEATIDIRYVSTDVPDCSYGYGQCRQSCALSKDEEMSEKNFQEQAQCFQECNFLYQDCRKI